MSTTELNQGNFSVKTSNFGAELTAITLNEVDYLWDGNPNYWSGQAPILFPIVGSIPEQGLQSARGPVRLARHGLARKTNHRLLEQTATHVCYELCSNAQSKENYPFDFKLNIAYDITGTNTLTHTFSVTNTGDVHLPFVVGGHPAFRVPFADDQTGAFENYYVQFTRPWSYEAPSLNLTTGILDFASTWTAFTKTDILPLRHDMFSTHDTLVLRDVPDSSVQLRSTSSDHGIELLFEGWDYLGIWSAAPEAPFVAIEPWKGCASSTDEDEQFEHKRGMQILAPGETSVQSFSIRVF